MASLGRDPFTMKKTISQLKKKSWIDLYTRAVFVEFVVYNPNLNIFGVSLTVVEFFAGGGNAIFNFSKDVYVYYCCNERVKNI